MRHVLRSLLRARIVYACRGAKRAITSCVTDTARRSRRWSDDGVAGFTTRQVAESATHQVPAHVYDLFGDQAGLGREIFFEGFRRLAAPTRSWQGPVVADPHDDLMPQMAGVCPGFVRANPVW